MNKSTPGQKLPLTVVHYGEHDPRETKGGVETFALNLRHIFENVEYMTPKTQDFSRIIKARTPVICDNHFATDWPEDFPLIGFQHGVALVKARATRSLGRLWMARRQRSAAHRKNMVWVACAEWISAKFDNLYGSKSTEVIYHPIDLENFSGGGGDPSSTLILHDGRTEHKGKKLFAILEKKFPDLRFETLSCPHDQVPERMKRAKAFVHLSRYEGNSIVCNEAMAMDLPCLFTDVGLMQDKGCPSELVRIDGHRAFRDEDYLVHQFQEFCDSLGAREYHPRKWVSENATHAIAQSKWKNAIAKLEALHLRASK